MPEYWRRLPHYHPDGTDLFVTWRLHGTVPMPARSERYGSPGHAFVAHDRALACDHEHDFLRDEQIARLVAAAILEGHHRSLYELQAWVIMPNHVHLLMLPRGALARITQWLKGSTARAANQALSRQGQPFWQQESYDHWVRTEKEFDRIVRYIEENPVAAGLVKSAEDWAWSSAARVCGDS
jgi:putative transposase